MAPNHGDCTNHGIRSPLLVPLRPSLWPQGAMARPFGKNAKKKKKPKRLVVPRVPYASLERTSRTARRARTSLRTLAADIADSSKEAKEDAIAELVQDTFGDILKKGGNKKEKKRKVTNAEINITGNLSRHKKWEYSEDFKFVENAAASTWKTMLTGKGPPAPKCFCKVRAVYRISKTKENKGKGFFVCKNPPGKKGDKNVRCNFFKWK